MTEIKVASGPKKEKSKKAWLSLEEIWWKEYNVTLRRLRENTVVVRKQLVLRNVKLSVYL